MRTSNNRRRVSTSSLPPVDTVVVDGRSVPFRQIGSTSFKLADPPHRSRSETTWYLVEYHDDEYLIPDSRKRHFWICCVLCVTLPLAYVLGFYAGNGGSFSLAREGNETSPIQGDNSNNQNKTTQTTETTTSSRNPSSTVGGGGFTIVSVPDPSTIPTSSEEEDSIWINEPGSASAATFALESGPLIGHMTHQSVKLWIYHGQHKQEQQDESSHPQLAYRKVGDNRHEYPAKSVDMPPNPETFNSSIVQLESLEADTIYEYQIRIHNERVAHGRFRTAALTDNDFDGIELNYLLASCISLRRYPEQPVWTFIRELFPEQQYQQQLDFAVLAGDTIYLDEREDSATSSASEKGGEVLLERVWSRNVEQRQEAHFANFIANIPTYSTWDDHDYGSNGADRHQPGKENSLLAFQSLWANPSYGTESAEGVFYTFSRGNHIQFFVMDNRWYRDPETESQFGSVQNQWLFDQLITSTATFKVIVTASDVSERGMAEDLGEIGAIVARHQISGVIFHAGDIHRNEYKKFPNHGRWPYDVIQITSSGIATEWRRPFALIHVNTKLQDPEMTVSFYGATSANIDHLVSWTNDPNTKCTQVPRGDRHNEHRCTEVIRLSDLMPSS